MTIRPDEITAILKQQIKNYQAEIGVQDQGSVLMVGDGIARVYGLDQALAGELLEFPKSSLWNGFKFGRRQYWVCYFSTI